MFVIMECWYNLLDQNRHLPLPERVGCLLHLFLLPLPALLQVGQTMRHAGISVTVTSITDVMAFGLGAATVQDSYLFTITNCSVL